MALCITSFNCKNVETSVEEIRLLAKSADVILLQETWLTNVDIPMLGNIDSNFYYKGISSINTDTGILRGRKHGGLAILWKKCFGTNCRIIEYDDERLLGIEITCNQLKLFILNCYLPFSCYANLDEYSQYLDKISAILDSCDTPYCMAVGDFNADTSNKEHLFGNILATHVLADELVLSDVSMMDSTTFTFSAGGNTSWLDHILSSINMHRLVSHVRVNYDINVSSDHLPLTATINARPPGSEDHVCDKDHQLPLQFDWSRASDHDLFTYHNMTDVNLAVIKLDYDMLHCKDCTNTEHIAAIDHLYGGIVEALKKSTPGYGQSKHNVKRHVPGWNECVKELHSQARDAFLLWRRCSSPRSGMIYDVMRQSRSRFKLALRKCRADRDKHMSDSLATKLLKNNTKEFWDEVKKVSSSSVGTQASTIGGATGSKDICAMWSTTTTS